MAANMTALATYILALLALTSVRASPAVRADYRRTVIFIRAQTAPGQNVFLRGGTSNPETTCSPPTTSDPCSVPIVHRITPADSSSSYAQWSAGDHYLDWNGAELLQGEFQGLEAGGTPLMWTTDQSIHPARVEIDGFGYTPLNRFEQHFWMIDVDMDCSRTFNGWFDFKGYVTPTPGWEGHINQYNMCGGTREVKPAATLNHMGRCGEMNLYYWEEDECNFYEIPNMPEVPPLGA